MVIVPIEKVLTQSPSTFDLSALSPIRNYWRVKFAAGLSDLKQSMWNKTLNMQIEKWEKLQVSILLAAKDIMINS